MTYVVRRIDSSLGAVAIFILISHLIYFTSTKAVNNICYIYRVKDLTLSLMTVDC